jgi:hypothetical protein
MFPVFRQGADLSVPQALEKHAALAAEGRLSQSRKDS